MPADGHPTTILYPAAARRIRSGRLWSVVHTWSSLVATAFLLVLCLTGLPLIFAH